MPCHLSKPLYKPKSKHLIKSITKNVCVKEVDLIFHKLCFLIRLDFYVNYRLEQTDRCQCCLTLWM